MIFVRFLVKGALVAPETELAWSAGLFDGEGCTSVLKAQRDKYSYVRMSISQKTPEVLERFKDAVGYGKIYKSNTREIYSLDIYKREDVVETLKKIWPYLSSPKKKQAENAFNTVGDNIFKKTHVALTPQAFDSFPDDYEVN
jgi:hypothetical protein